MLRSVYQSMLWERKISLVWYVVGMVGLVGITVGVYPSVREGADAFTALLNQMPKGMLSFFGNSDAAQLMSPAGFVNSRLNASIGVIVVIVFAISLGTAAIAGEEDRGTLDLLLANPISRARVVLERVGAMGTLIAVVAFATFLVLLVADPLVDLGFSVVNMVASNVGLALTALVFGTMALAVGGVTGRRSFTLGTVSGVTVTAFFVNGLAPLVDWLRWPRELSPFYWLQRSDPLRNGFAWGDDLLMLAVVGGFVAVAVWGFNRRDTAV